MANRHLYTELQYNLLMDLHAENLALLESEAHVLLLKLDLETSLQR